MKPKHRYNNFLCKSWRIKNQLIVYSLIIIIITTVLVYILESVFFTLVQQQFQEASQQIFTQEANTHLQFYMDLQQRQAALSFLNSEMQLQTIERIYQFVQSGVLQSNMASYDCLNNPKQNDSYAYNSSFCYMLGNPTDPYNHSNFSNMITLTALLTQYLTIMNLDRYTYYTDDSDNEFFSVYTGDNYTNFRAHSRPWYIDHIRNMNSSNQITQFSNPYLAFVNSVYVAQTLTLTYPNNSFAGVVAQDFSLDKIPKINDSKYQLIMANESGHTVLGQFYLDGIQEIINVDNYSITGYNTNNWITLKHLADSNIQESIIVNQPSGIRLHVAAVKLTYPAYYIIMSMNSSMFDIENLLIQQQLTSFENQYLNLMLIAIFPFLAFAISIQCCIIQILLKPLDQLEYQTKRQIYKQFNSKHITYSKILGRNLKGKTISRAYTSMKSSMKESKSQNNQVCQDLQEITYPMTQYQFAIDTTLLENYIMIDLDIYQMFRRGATNRFKQNIFPLCHQTILLKACRTI